jgi:hypothetical protein
MCNFENNAQPICSWTHDNDADFKWKRVRGDEVNNIPRFNNLVQTYGPDRDHTLGKKKNYLFLITEKRIFYFNKYRNITRTFSIS